MNISNFFHVSKRKADESDEKNIKRIKETEEIHDGNKNTIITKLVHALVQSIVKNKNKSSHRFQSKKNLIFLESS